MLLLLLSALGVPTLLLNDLLIVVAAHEDELIAVVRGRICRQDADGNAPPGAEGIRDVLVEFGRRELAMVPKTLP